LIFGISLFEAESESQQKQKNNKARNQKKYFALAVNALT